MDRGNKLVSDITGKVIYSNEAYTYTWGRFKGLVCGKDEIDAYDDLEEPIHLRPEAMPTIIRTPWYLNQEQD